MSEESALIERITTDVSALFEGRLSEFERENDRLLGEVRTIQRKYSTVKLERDRLQAEQVYVKGRHPELDFPTGAGNPPVIVFDLHGTLTPCQGFPIDEPPYDLVQEACIEWAARNVILVVATAALQPYKPPQILKAREQLAWAFITEYGLPIKYVTGKVGYHTVYDDRMVPVDIRSSNPWEAVIKGVEAQLAKRAELGKDGMWRLVALPEIGKRITDFPEEEEIPPDQPRGFSTPIFNVDVHRCLVQANSSENDSPLQPGAKEVVNEIYGMGYTVQPSCAGFDPATHSPSESDRRERGLQRTLRTQGVKYDEFVSKVHGTVFVDDKGVTHTGNWLKDRPLLLKHLSTPSPEDEITGSYRS